MQFRITKQQYDHAIAGGVKNPLEPGEYKDLPNKRVVNLNTSETFSYRSKLNTTKGYTVSSVKAVEKFHQWNRYEMKNPTTMQGFLSSYPNTKNVMIVVCGIALTGWSELEPGDYGCRTVVTNTRIKDIKWLQVDAFLANHFDSIDTYSVITR